MTLRDVATLVVGAACILLIALLIVVLWTPRPDPPVSLGIVFPPKDQARLWRPPPAPHALASL